MLQVEYFSDVLCVWAFIGEKRLAEVKENLGKDIHINLHFLPNFAACHPKIKHGWAARGEFEGYANHVREVADQFDIKVHEDTWQMVQPSSSMVPHAIIKAVQRSAGNEVAAKYCSAVRSAFFEHGKNIAQLSVLKEIALEFQLNWSSIELYFNDGFALSDLQQDFSKALLYQVSISPAWVFNEGRQRLIGNVGYRVIEANLKELIEQKPMAQSWC